MQWPGAEIGGRKFLKMHKNEGKTDKELNIGPSSGTYQGKEFLVLNSVSNGKTQERCKMNRKIFSVRSLEAL